MKVLLYSLNYAPEIIGIGKYSGELGDWLVENGHEVRVVCSPPYYPEWQLGEGYRRSWQYRREIRNGVKLFRCPLFVPKNPGMLSRLLHLLSFAMSSLPVILRQVTWKPDVVMLVEPTFFCVPATLLLSKLTGAKSLLHIQDFELDAMFGSGLAKFKWQLAFCYAVESFFMRCFESISSISRSMLVKAGEKSKYSVPLYLFHNWVDTDFISPDVDTDLFRQRWGLSETIQVVLYSGNLGKKQGLDILIQAAKLLADEQDVLFLILGDGVERLKLMDQTQQLKLGNIRFDSLQSYDDLPALMALADVHLVVQKRNVADAVLPSKLTTILSAGGYALITAEAETELGLLCEQFPGIAVRVEPESLEEFVTALRQMLIATRVNRQEFNCIARQYAVEHLHKQNVLQKFEEMLVDLISK